MSAADAPAGLLREAYIRYDAAMAGRNRQEQINARGALVMALVGAGWEPPAEVQEQMARDENSLRRHREALLIGEGSGVEHVSAPHRGLVDERVVS